MNETPLEFSDTPAYASRWIVGYVLALILAVHLAALPGPANSPATRNPASWASR